MGREVRAIRREDSTPVLKEFALQQVKHTLNIYSVYLLYMQQRSKAACKENIDDELMK